MLIDIEKIEVGERLRSRLDPQKLRQLADDMEHNGQLQEIVVAINWGTNNRGTTIVEGATLIAGYRRLEAAKLLGWTEIRCTRQLGGEIDPESDIDLLRAEYSENELRENFTEMERVSYGVKLKERIAAAARERMRVGKKLDYEYDLETGYKVFNDDTGVSSGEGNNPICEADPPTNLSEGWKTETDHIVASKIGMSGTKFKQGEYVLKHGTEEQHAAIDCGEASISGVYNELKPKTQKPRPPEHEPATFTTPVLNPKLTNPSEQEITEHKIPEQKTSEQESLKIKPPKHTPTTSQPPKPAKLNEKEKEERAMAALSPKEREAVERHNAFSAMTPEEKIVDLQAQLKTERSRAAAAETELSRIKDELHNAVLHRDGIISSLERQLEAAHAKIKELEG